MGYLGNQPTIGAYHVLDSITLSNGQSAYSMQLDGANFSPQSVNHMLVIINGVPQPTSAYSINGHTLTLSSAATTGDVLNEIRVFGDILNIGTPSDGTVNNSKCNFVSTSSAAGLDIKGDGTTDGTLRLLCSQGTHGVKIKSPAHSASQSYTLTLPATAPSNGKALITDGSGNLSFGSAGGLVKLFVGSGSSASSFEIDETYINSTYDNYFVTLNASPASDTQQLRLNFNTGGSQNTNSYYAYETSVGSSSTYGYNHTGAGYIPLAYQSVGNATGESQTNSFHLLNVNSTTHACQLHGQVSMNTNAGDTQFGFVNGGFILAQRALVVNGFTLYFASGNITVNNISVYGYAKS